MRKLHATSLLFSVITLGSSLLLALGQSALATTTPTMPALGGGAAASGSVSSVDSGPVRVGDQRRVGGLIWDAHEFTVGQFKAFVAATKTVTRAEREGGGYIYASGWEQRSGWNWRTPFGRPAADNEPAVHITFDEAQAACRWAGGRLPTDAEWTSAAYLEQRPNPPSGFVSGRRYPFPNGDSAAASHCLSGCGRYSGLAPAGSLDRGLGHVAVGTTPPGVNGLIDMGGNVWEWVDTGSGGERITRGASWWYGPERQREGDVATKPVETRVAYIGFRCVRDAQARSSLKP